MKARVNLSLDSDTLNRSKEIGINLSQFLQYTLDNALNKLEVNAEGGIRTHELLRDRSLGPAPLTWLGNPRTEVFNKPRAPSYLAH